MHCAMHAQALEKVLPSGVRLLSSLDISDWVHDMCSTANLPFPAQEYRTFVVKVYLDLFCCKEPKEHLQ